MPIANMTIYLDFDGTVVEHEYPDIGRHNDGCFEVIKKLQVANHHIILNTYRANLNMWSLKAAVGYLNNSGKINPITEIANKKIDPTPWNWVKHFKSKTIFIDDICEDIPLKLDFSKTGDMVDWEKLNIEFLEHKIY